MPVYKICLPFLSVQMCVSVFVHVTIWTFMQTCVLIVIYPRPNFFKHSLQSSSSDSFHHVNAEQAILEQRAAV